MSIQYESHGQVEIKVVQKNETIPTTIINLTEEFTIIVILTLDSAFFTSENYQQTKFDKLKATIYFESVGPGSGYSLGLDELSWTEKQQKYQFKFTLPSGKIDIGVFKLTALIEGFDEKGNKLPLVWFKDGPLIQAYS